MNKLNIPIQEKDFEDYIKFKILDSMTNPGVYKKFLLARKDQGFDWAIQMCQNIQNVQSAIKLLEQKEQEIKTSQLSSLHIIWQHVTENNLPPTDLPLTIADCHISQKTEIPCVIIKGKGRGANPFTVNSKFANFFLDLWIVYKLDILIKTFSKQKIMEIDPQQSLPMATIVEKLNSEDSDLKYLAGAFFSAYSHVYKSIIYGINALI